MPLSDSRRLILIVSLILTALLTSTDCGFCLTWSGRVVEDVTGKPVAGVIVVRSWNIESSTPAGKISAVKGAVEGVTDSEGKVVVSGAPLSYYMHLPLMEQISENQTIVFKSGYEPIMIDRSQNIVQVARVPTNISARQKQLQRLIRFLPAFYLPQANQLNQVITREGEFIEIMQRLMMGLVSHQGRVVDDESLASPDTVSNLTNSTLGPSDTAHVVAIQPFSKTPSKPEFMAAGSNSNRQTDKAFRHDLFGKNTSTDHLLEALHENSGVARYRALQALCTRTDPRIPQALVSFLGDPSRALRSAVKRCLLQLGPCSVAEMLVDTIRRGNHDARRAAIRMLGTCMKTKAVKALIGLLSEPSFAVRSAAVKALGRMEATEAVNSIVDALKADERLRLTVIQALGRIDTPASTKALFSELISASTHRRETAEALASHAPESVSFLISALNHDELDVRRAAAYSLGGTRSAEAATPLLRLWNDPDPVLRKASAASLINIGPVAIDPVTNQLEAPDGYHRWKAAWVLSMIDHPRTVPLLVDVLTDPCSELRWTAIAGLGQKKATRAVCHLKPLLEDPDPGIRSITKTVLGMISSNTDADIK